MSYHDNLDISDVVAIVVNDRTGNDCGLSYERRCFHATHTCGAEASLLLCAERASDYRARRFGSRHLTRGEIREARDVLVDYYGQHVKELQATEMA